MYNCTKCNKNFKRQTDFANHMRWKHKEFKQYECRICKKKFNDNSQRVIHEKYFVHKDPIELFENDLCDYGCGQKAKFIIGEKKCCSKSFNSCLNIRQKNSTSNKLKHSNTKYKKLCEICNQMIGFNKFKEHKEHCCLTQEKIDLIRKNYYEFMSIEEIKSKYGLFNLDIHKALKGCQKRSLSEVCKRSHKEGKGNNWRTTEESYPEVFFEKFLINNGFKKNSDFIREKQISFYRIDFFFPKKMIAIEIDGLQHIRFNYQIEIDRRKNLFLKSQGIKVIRILWKDLFKDSKSKLFIISEYLKGNKANIDLVSRKIEYP